MSFPPDTGSVELTAFREHAARLLAKGERLDRRGFATLRTPTVVREIHSATTGPSPASARGPSKQAKYAANTSATHADADVAEGPRAPCDGLLSSVIYHDDGGACATCTVHAVFGPPWPQQPTEGRLNVRVLAPFVQDLMAAGGFTSTGGYSNAAVATGLADFPLMQVQGYVRSVLVACLDLSQLSIYPAEACWVLTVTISLMNVDGALRSVALHAAVAALHRLTLPRAMLPNGDIVEARPLRMACVPVAATYGVLAAKGSSPGGALLADTTAVEELIADGTVTVALDAAGDIVDLQQLGEHPLAPAVLMDVVEHFAKGGSQTLRKALLSS